MTVVLVADSDTKFTCGCSGELKKKKSFMLFRSNYMYVAQLMYDTDAFLTTLGWK